MKLDAVFILVPAVVYGVGLLMHNAYLAHYGVYQFSLAEARYAFVGAFAIFNISLSFSIIVMKLDFQKFRPLVGAEHLVCWSARVGAAILMALLPIAGVDLFGSEFKDVVGLDAATKWIGAVYTITLLLFTTWWQFPKASFSKVSQASIAIPIWLLIWFLGQRSQVAHDVAFFFAMIFVGLVIVLAGFADGEAGKETLDYLLGRKDAVLMGWANRAIAVVCLAGVCLNLVSSYATYMYPHISRAWGGGRAAQVHITGSSVDEQGFLIDEGQDWITLLVGDQVKRIATRLIDRVEPLEALPPEATKKHEPAKIRG